MAQVEAVKYEKFVPPSKKANLIIGIQGVMLLRYQHDLLDCRAKLRKIAEAQGKAVTAP